MTLTLEQLQAIMPRMARNPKTAASYLPHLLAALEEAQINTRNRIAAFLAQLAHESGELKYWRELASGAAYEGRKDLGNTQPGDGVRYAGRGPIQITGRRNVTDCGKALGLDLVNHPELLETPEVGFRSAAWFWTSRDLNPLADEGNFDRITRIINGGYNGKAHRDAYYERALSVLPEENSPSRASDTPCTPR
jgi:predicted chitinase